MGRRWLVTCFSLELVALAAWVGGLVVIIASVIPAVFNSFGMEQGGRFLTRVFDGYNRVTVVAMAVLAFSMGARAWQKTRIPHTINAGVSRGETLVFGVMLLCAFLILVVLGPRSVALQEQAFAVKDEAAKKEAYAAFFKTHTVVRGLYVVNLCLGIGLTTLKVRNWTRITGA